MIGNYTVAFICLISFYLFWLFFLVLSHHYGKEGRDTKQIESKGILLDFDLFQNMSTDTFTNAITDKLNQFIEYLNNDSTKKGKRYF
jgi:hypothetical protein